MVTREEMLLNTMVSGNTEKELSSIYQIGEDEPYATLTVDCNAILSLICC